MKLFIHGVPDTGFMWSPLIAALGLADDDFQAPDMPGFDGAAAPFDSTKEGYLGWVTGQLETLASSHGPIDIVGHDWGAPLVAMAAQARPDLIRTWTVINAVPEPSYEWHSTARIWQTPVLGEMFFLMGSAKAFHKQLSDAGMPKAIADHEVPRIDKHMKRAILKLYRSAKNPKEWDRDFSNVADRGMVLWGAGDPFVPVKFAHTFTERWSIPLRVEEGVGHWGLCERPEAFAAHLHKYWAQ